MSVNKVILVGRLGQDPELKSTPGGNSVCNFSVATNEAWTDKSGQKQERTEWHRVVVWGRQAELCSQYLKKGRQVYLEGKLQTRQWQDKNGQTRYTTEVQGQSVRFLGGGAEAGRGASMSGGGDDFAQDMPGQGSGPVNTNDEPRFTEDDIPF